MCLLCLLEEKLCYLVGQLPFEYVAHESFADVSTTSFVAEDVAKCWVAAVECLSVVKAGVAACAKDADDAGLLLAYASGSSEHVAFHMDVSSGADCPTKCICHNGGFFGGASGSIKMDGMDGFCRLSQSGEQFMLQNGTDGVFVLLERVDALGVYHLCAVFDGTPSCLGGAAVCDEGHYLVVWWFGCLVL